MGTVNERMTTVEDGPGTVNERLSPGGPGPEGQLDTAKESLSGADEPASDPDEDEAEKPAKKSTAKAKG